MRISCSKDESLGCNGYKPIESQREKTLRCDSLPCDDKNE
jgi:hypothetical protein